MKNIEENKNDTLNSSFVLLKVIHSWNVLSLKNKINKYILKVIVMKKAAKDAAFAFY